MHNQNIYLKLSERRICIINYHVACAILFIPLTSYTVYKLRKRRLQKNKLDREHKKIYFEKLYKILKVAGSSFNSRVLLKLLFLRGGNDVMVPGVDDCVDVPEPSYIDNERILRYLNDKFSKLDINGIIYITKEALCYLAKHEGLIDFPVVFLERIKIDGFVTFSKVFGQWLLASIGIIITAGQGITAPIAFILVGSIWLHVSSIKILQPSIRSVNELTGKYVPRITSRKDAVVFDAKEQPLPPAIEYYSKPVENGVLDTNIEYTEYEIRTGQLVGISEVSKLNNKFSDRHFKRYNLRPPAKMVTLGQKIEEWRKNSPANEELQSQSRIDDWLETWE